MWSNSPHVSSARGPADEVTRHGRIAASVYWQDGGQRVVILGRGAVPKSTLARLGATTTLPTPSLGPHVPLAEHGAEGLCGRVPRWRRRQRRRNRRHGLTSETNCSQLAAADFTGVVA